MLQRPDLPEGALVTLRFSLDSTGGVIASGVLCSSSQDSLLDSVLANWVAQCRFPTFASADTSTITASLDLLPYVATYEQCVSDLGVTVQPLSNPPLTLTQLSESFVIIGDTAVVTRTIRGRYGTVRDSLYLDLSTGCPAFLYAIRLDTGYTVVSTPMDSGQVQFQVCDLDHFLAGRFESSASYDFIATRQQ
jgi:hypothetical protein